MKAVKIIKALCYEGWNIDYCDVITTSDTPWDDLVRIFPFGTYKGVVENNTNYFYYWSSFHVEVSRFDKPDLILYRENTEEEIYLWKIE